MKFNKVQPNDWDRSRLTGILNQFNGKKALVVGDVGVDRYTVGAVERISPEAPVPIVAVQEEMKKLGLGANVADNVKSLGGIPFLLGVVGEDYAAGEFRSLLRSVEISDSCIVSDSSRRTTLKERVVSEQQQLLRVDYDPEGSVSEATEKLVLEEFKKNIECVDIVVLEDYAKGLMTNRLFQSVFQLAKDHNKTVLVDPNSRTSLRMYRGARVLTPNKKEAEALSGKMIEGEQNLAEVGQFLLYETQAEHVIITLGRDGMAIFSAGKEDGSIIPTCAREVYDVSGAGDTVISSLALGIAAGATVEEAAALGNLAAGVVVSKRGTATVTVKEILSSMDFFCN